jgi:hypothetical protein
MQANRKHMVTQVEIAKNRSGKKNGERKRGANKTGKLVKGERGKQEANGEVGERKTGGKWRIM